MTEDRALAASAAVARPLPALPPLLIFRCPRCQTMLAELRLPPGALVRIKCPRCNALAVKERGVSNVN